MFAAGGVKEIQGIQIQFEVNGAFHQGVEFGIFGLYARFESLCLSQQFFKVGEKVFECAASALEIHGFLTNVLGEVDPLIEDFVFAAVVLAGQINRVFVHVERYLVAWLEVEWVKVKFIIPDDVKPSYSGMKLKP